MWQWVHCNLFPAFQKSCCFFFGVFHGKWIAIRIGCIIYKHKKHVLSLCRTFLLRNATKPPTNLFFFKHTQVWGSNLHRKVCNKLPINLASYIVHQQSSENHKSHIILETKNPLQFISYVWCRRMIYHEITRIVISQIAYVILLESKWFSAHFLWKESYFSCIELFENALAQQLFWNICWLTQHLRWKNNLRRIQSPSFIMRLTEE